MAEVSTEETDGCRRLTTALIVKVGGLELSLGREDEFEGAVGI